MAPGLVGMVEIGERGRMAAAVVSMPRRGVVADGFMVGVAAAAGFSMEEVEVVDFTVAAVVAADFMAAVAGADMEGEAVRCRGLKR